MAPLYLISFLLAALAMTQVSRAQTQPSNEPIPRVETGMHAAIIKHAAIDQAGHLLATASQDKTVRLWSLPDGKLIRVLRPPIGDGYEGQVFALAISPDGQRVIVGGGRGLRGCRPIFFICSKRLAAV